MPFGAPIHEGRYLARMLSLRSSWALAMFIFTATVLRKVSQGRR